MTAGVEFLLSGIILGLAAGLSPGPLITLVFSETLKNGKKEGIKIAISPLLTDSLIILLVLLILPSLTTNNLIIGTISLLGACYLTYLGFENLTVKIEKYEVNITRKHTHNALIRGIIANLLSPYPYIFWLSIGGPMILESAHIHISVTTLFILGFYATLIGSKTAIALIIDKSKTLIKNKYYLYIIRALGITLIIFALTFIKNGLTLIGLL